MLQPSLKLTVPQVAIRPKLNDKVALHDKLEYQCPKSES
jgi:hypothetical protein